MSSQSIQQTRSVGGFSAVVLRSDLENELLITQGDHESLDIEAPEEIIQQVQTRITRDTLHIEYHTGPDGTPRAGGLLRPVIRYSMSVQQLNRLELFAAVTVEIPSLVTGRLMLKFNGPGEIKIGELQAGRLEVYMPGPCKARLAGRVAEQYVEISGPGDYQARYLESDKAEISILAVGNATVWVHDNLIASMLGIGNISYYGSPTVRKNTSPLGRLIKLEK